MNQVCVAPAWRSALQRGLGGGGRLRGLDIDIKEGNPQAIGVYARAAQGTSVESVRIFAVDAAVGLQGGAGSGGSHIDIQVHGGVVGLDLSESQPAPTITRAVLVNQTGAAINYAYPGRQTLTLTGVVIERNAPGPAIEAGAQAISMVDSVIECGGGPALSVSNGTNVLLKEVWTRGCGVVVAALPGGGDQPPVPAGPKWTRVRLLAAGRTAVGSDEPYGSPVYLDGAEQKGPLLHIDRGVDAPPSPLPDFCAPMGRRAALVGDGGRVQRQGWRRQGRPDDG